MMLYFAYGSNMDWPRMRDRCARAQFLLKALLLDYELQFTRTSRKLKCGTADVLPAPGKSVWGVVYHLEADDRRRLDEKEGVGIGAYRPENIRVYAEGEQQRPLDAFTYVVCAKESPRPRPSVAYLEHLLAGAERWQLSTQYIEALRSFETQPLSDSDKAKALARTIAAQVIQKCPTIWDDLKHRLADCQSVDVYGSMQHMDFLSAVQDEVSRLSEADRALLQQHIRRPPDSRDAWTYHDFITGQIFSRAHNAARRM